VSIMNSDGSSVRFFSTRDAPPDPLRGERIAVLGFGHLGRPLAMNRRNSGVSSLVVGNIADEYAEQAAAEGFSVLSIGEATAASDVVLMLLPDEVLPEVFAADIVPNLSLGSAIAFASGYNLAYGLIEPPPGVDLLLLAPRMGGENARQRFLNGQGFFAYLAVEQDASGKAWARLLGLADLAGILRAGALELDARREADIDLFVEQSIGAALGVSIMLAFSIGVEAGIPPEAMVVEMYMSEEMESVHRAFREEGFFRSSGAHGPTAMYGGYLRTMELLQSELSSKFHETLNQIRSGAFARQFQAERKSGYPTLSIAQAFSMDDHPQTQAEERVRALLGHARHDETVS